jgi:glycosyltransferase involved in cell wall biosynthesis
MMPHNPARSLQTSVAMAEVLQDRPLRSDPLGGRTNARPSRRIVLVANTSWFLYNFRAKLMEALREAGHVVIAVAPEDAFTQRIIAAGYRYRHVAISRTGTNPLTELRTVLALRAVLREENPAVVFSFTPKGNIYCALAADPSCSVVATINGLGRVFIVPSWRRFVVTNLYRVAMKRTRHMFIENEGDLPYFLETCRVQPQNCAKIPGLGVDLEKFAPAHKAPSASGATVFLLIARLLWEKGLKQYVEAAQAIRALFPQTRFQILGPLEPRNESAIPRSVLDQWVRGGAVEYLGVTEDVRRHVLAADCVVLPTYYREGVPHSLLEAAAMGKPLITTDIPGCKTAVDDGVTGYLCRPQDTDDLIGKLHTFLQLDPERRRQLGAAGRAKMEREFDEARVIRLYMERVP